MDRGDKRLNDLRTARNSFNEIIPFPCNGSSNNSLNGISLKGLVIFLPINPRQGICFHIALSRSMMDMEVIVSQTSSPPVSHCI